MDKEVAFWKEFKISN